MLESALERKLVNGVKKAGGLAWKFVSPGHAGVPDRIVMMPGGHVFFIELKTETGTLTPLQIEIHNTLRDMGFNCRTLYGKQYVEGFIREIQSMAIPADRRRVDPLAPEVRALFRDGTWQDCDYTDSCKEADR